MDLFDVKYELMRTLKHMFYVSLVFGFFGCWYVLFGLLTGVWDFRNWNDELAGLYFCVSIPTGFGYAMYRLLT